MVDYSIDDSFDLHFNEVNDFETVAGREEFEQDLLIECDAQFGDIIGGLRTSQNIEQKIELLATRIAKKFDVIQSISRIDVRQIPERADAISLNIIYTSGESFEEVL
jgi:hypothetical protein